MSRVDYTREELVAICEQAVVPLAKWSNRDTPHSQEKLGLCWVLLKAGCDFDVTRERPVDAKSGCWTDERTIWLTVYWPDFNDFEYGTRRHPSQSETFYLPTVARLEKANGGDWY